MPRATPAGLATQIPKRNITQSTIDITLRDGTVKRYRSGSWPLNLGGNDYEAGILRVGEISETLGQATNRVQVKISNVDQQFGLFIASDLRKMELADVVIKRYLRDVDNPAVWFWLHFFSGRAVNSVVDDEAVTFDVIPDTTAAGTCIATETLSPNNGWVFPETPEQSPPGSEGNPPIIRGPRGPNPDEI